MCFFPTTNKQDRKCDVLLSSLTLIKDWRQWIVYLQFYWRSITLTRDRSIVQRDRSIAHNICTTRDSIRSGPGPLAGEFLKFPSLVHLSCNIRVSVFLRCVMPVLFKSVAVCDCVWFLQSARLRCSVVISDYSSMQGLRNVPRGLIRDLLPW